MIFVTVGTQLPFDRLTQAVNDWALQNPDQMVIAQTGLGRADFAGMACYATLDQTTFRDTLEAADIIVAHAGMGSILLAAEVGKQIIIMPRRADLGEHRNDHQRDTAAKMASLSNVHVAENAAEIGTVLSTLTGIEAAAYEAIANTAQPQLLAALYDFIWSEARQSSQAPAFLHQVAI